MVSTHSSSASHRHGRQGPAARRIEAPSQRLLPVRPRCLQERAYDSQRRHPWPVETKRDQARRVGGRGEERGGAPPHAAWLEATWHRHIDAALLRKSGERTAVASSALGAGRASIGNVATGGRLRGERLGRADVLRDAYAHGDGVGKRGSWGVRGRQRSSARRKHSARYGVWREAQTEGQKWTSATAAACRSSLLSHTAVSACSGWAPHSSLHLGFVSAPSRRSLSSHISPPCAPV